MKKISDEPITLLDYMDTKIIKHTQRRKRKAKHEDTKYDAWLHELRKKYVTLLNYC
jgi:hypothetical protein